VVLVGGGGAGNHYQSSCSKSSCLQHQVLWQERNGGEPSDGVNLLPTESEIESTIVEAATAVEGLGTL
jgi:hypothetical protein